MFTDLLEQEICTKLLLESNENIDDVVQFSTCSIQEAA